MEVVGLGFPIYQIWKHKRAARETTRALADFDAKRLNFHDDSTASGSMKTRSTTSKRGRMYPMESLDECLAGDYDGLQLYASCMELNGENIIFLTKVLAFNTACQKVFHETCKSTSDFRRARTEMFRVGLSIFVSLIHSATAPYPINIEFSIYKRLDAIFGPATTLVARPNYLRSDSITTATSSSITPWDEPLDHDGAVSSSDENPFAENSFPMHSMSSGGLSTPSSAKVKGNESSEHIVSVRPGEADGAAEGVAIDPLQGVRVPGDFDERVFDAAFKSVRYMVWTETWQRYQVWKRGPRNSSLERGLDR
jgi:hypothetical protein